jgi:YHS domain-containing protein
MLGQSTLCLHGALPFNRREARRDEARDPGGSRDQDLVAAQHEEHGPMVYEDVVCNRPIDASTSVWASRHHSETYFFCSLMCRERFELEPEDFLPHGEDLPVPNPVLVRFVS